MGTFREAANRIFRAIARRIGVASARRPEERVADEEQARRIAALNQALFSDAQEVGRAVDSKPPFTYLGVFHFSRIILFGTEGFMVEVQGIRASDRGVDNAFYGQQYTANFLIGLDGAVYVIDDREGLMELSNKTGRVGVPRNAAETIMINHAAEIIAIGEKSPAAVARAARDAKP